MKKQPKENSEFRNCHAAQALLKAYIAGHRNLDIIKQFNFSEIERYDVWKCVFEKEPAAYKILQEKDLYNLLIKYPAMIESEGKEIFTKTVATLCVVHLERMTEWKSPLSVDEAIQIMVDIFGDKFISILLAEAKHSLAQRIEIVKPYYKHDDEWVGYSKKVVEALEAL